jgi:hypothetical protein
MFKLTDRRSPAHRIYFCAVIVLAGSMGFSSLVRAAGHNLADYALRVHIYQFDSISHYKQGMLDAVEGEGRANLFENEQPRAFDFGYQCTERIMSMTAYETYPARWKKENRTLEILLPVMGKPGSFNGCELKVVMKETAYFRHNGLLGEEPVAVYKAWMDKYQYDPEHGKNEPQPAPGAAASVARPQEPTVAKSPASAPQP